MKIALISCNFERQGFPPMGIMYLSSYIKQHLPDVEIKLYDLFPDVETLVSEGFSLIGFSCFSIQYYQAEQYAKLLRNKFNGLICIGGIHVTLTHKLPFWADIAVIGEGEQTFYELLLCLRNNNLQITNSLNDIDGIIFRYENNIIELIFRLIPDEKSGIFANIQKIQQRLPTMKVFSGILR